MTDASIAYLEGLLLHHPPTALIHRLARAKLSAFSGDRMGASSALNELLLESTGRSDPFIFFQYLTHLALLTDQFDLVGHLINQRFETRAWFNVTSEKHQQTSVTVFRWEVRSEHESRFVVPQDLLSSGRFDFTFNRLLYSLPMLATHFALAERVPGTVYLNLGDHGEVPGLAFCSNRPDFLLIPDPVFVSTLGYEELRKQVAQTYCPWTDRQPRAVWRGTTTGRLLDRSKSWRSLQRIQLCEIGCTHSELIDAGITDIVQITDSQSIVDIRTSGLMREPIAPDQFGKYKYQIDIDGNTNAWQGLYQKLLTGSPVLKIDSPFGYRQWYYDRLIPWDNYVPVASDMMDLVTLLTWLRANDDKARQIGERGRALALSLDYDSELKMAANTVNAAFRADQRQREPN